MQESKIVPLHPPPDLDLRAASVNANDASTTNDAPTAVASKVIGTIKKLSTTALTVLREHLQEASGTTSLQPTLASSPSKARSNIDLDSRIAATANIIDLALYGNELHGLRAQMPARSLYGNASYACQKAYWREVLQMPVEEVVRQHLAKQPFSTESDQRFLSTYFKGHTSIYLAEVASHDPQVIDRAIRLLPRYTHFSGATADPKEKEGLNPVAEVDYLNRLFSEYPLPKLGHLQVNLVDTNSFGTIEVTRHLDFNGTGIVYYSIGKEGVTYRISTENGLSDLTGLFPNLAVADPRAIKYPTYSELISAIKNEGHNIQYDMMERQSPKLPEFEASGPKALRYCSYEAQQSLATDLPVIDQERMNAVSSSWSIQVRLDVYAEAARSHDVAIRTHATNLVGIFPEGIPLLNEALFDSSPAVVKIAQQRLKDHEQREQYRKSKA